MRQEDHPQAGGHRQQGAEQSKHAQYTAPQLRPETPTAEQVAAHLDRARRVRDGQWMACCPAHDDRSPSLQITDGHSRLLLHCFSGCTFEEVRDVLQSRGILPTWEAPRGRPRLTQGDRDYMQSFVLLYRNAEQRGIQPTSRDRALYLAYRDRLAQEGIA